MWEELKDTYGLKISRKRVERLMREHGLQARGRRKHAVTTDSGHGLSAAENLLNREFGADGPGEKWVSDITYLRTRSGWLYLTVVIDLWDRKVIGWAFSEDLGAVHMYAGRWRWPWATGRPKQGCCFIRTGGYNIAVKNFGRRWKGTVRVSAGA